MPALVEKHTLCFYIINVLDFDFVLLSVYIDVLPEM